MQDAFMLAFGCILVFVNLKIRVPIAENIAVFADELAGEIFGIKRNAPGFYHKIGDVGQLFVKFLIGQNIILFVIIAVFFAVFEDIFPDGGIIIRRYAVFRNIPNHGRIGVIVSGGVFFVGDNKVEQTFLNIFRERGRVENVKGEFDIVFVTVFFLQAGFEEFRVLPGELGRQCRIKVIRRACLYFIQQAFDFGGGKPLVEQKVCISFFIAGYEAFEVFFQIKRKFRFLKQFKNGVDMASGNVFSAQVVTE